MFNKSLLTLVFLLTAQVLPSCKKSDESEVSATTKLSGSKYDFTTYKAASTKEYKGMREEMGEHIYDGMSEIIEDAKITHKKLNHEELIAIKLYTYSPYKELNNYLRTKNPEYLASLDDTIKTIATGLNKLDQKKCIVYRGMERSTGADKLVNDSAKVKRLIEKAFMSASDFKIAQKYAGPNGYILKIKSNRCRDISFIRKGSPFASTKEYVFPPGSEFSVDNDPKIKGANDKGTTTLELTEIVAKDPKFVAVEKGAKKNILAMYLDLLTGFPSPAMTTKMKIMTTLTAVPADRSESAQLPVEEDTRPVTSNLTPTMETSPQP